MSPNYGKPSHVRLMLGFVFLVFVGLLIFNYTRGTRTNPILLIIGVIAFMTIGTLVFLKRGR